jgi:hypothetical protein
MTRPPFAPTPTDRATQAFFGMLGVLAFLNATVLSLTLIA